MMDDGMRILVVDDNPDDVVVLHIVAEQLQPGIVLDVVETGDEALAHLDRPGTARAAVVILDWNLPGVTAREVIARMRSHHEWDDVPIVVCSGDDDPALADRVRALGADRYEVKSAGIDGVADMLRRALALTSPEPV